MADEPIAVVPAPATDAPVQATPVESGTQPTPQVVTVTLADWQRLNDDVATIKQFQKSAQSDKDKKKAQINKSFARKLAAVDAMKDDEGWDDREVKQRKKQYADEAALQTLELEGLADDDPAPAPAQALPPQAFGVNTPDEQKQSLLKTLTRFELSEKDVDLSPFLNRQVNTRAEAEALDEQLFGAINKAVRARAAKVDATAKELLDQQEAQTVAEDIEKFGNLGGNTNSGAPGDSGRRNSKDLNADLGAAYRRRYLTEQRK